MIARIPVRPCSDKVGDECMEISVNDEMENGESLLNQANVGPSSVIAKALHRTGS